MLQLRGAAAQRRVGLLRALYRAGPGLHQAVVAGLFFPREFEIGVGGGDIRRTLLDDRLLQGELCIEVADRGFGCGDVGIGLRQRGLEVAVVDLGQELPGLDRLVVADQNPRDVAGDLRRDDRGIRLHIGVIGRFQVAAGGEIIVAELADTPDAERNREYQRGALDRLPGRANGSFLFDVRDIRRDRHGILGCGLGAPSKERTGTP